jgi:L-sorbose 1-phosphate reductase
MKTKAVRLYGKNDLRLESFELPPIKDDEILAKVVSDSLCMSSYKAAVLGSEHSRVPKDIDINPTILGHEFCGVILEVGDKWKDGFKAGDRFTLQPAHKKNGTIYAPGYSYLYCGGNATYVIIPPEIMEMDCLFKFNSDTYFLGSLAEPMSCIIRAFHAVYHTQPDTYAHEMGIKKGGKMVILAGAGPMGMGAIDYALHNPDKRPALLAVTDISEERIQRAKQVYSAEDACKNGVNLIYVNTSVKDAVAELNKLTGGTGYDDVFVFAPVKEVIEQGDAIMGRDGCMNFFSGPSNPNLKAEVNFFNIHYSYTHFMGTAGGNNDDLRESLELMSEGAINPATMITHIGGLNCAAQTTLDLPNIPGGKKLIYNHISLPLTAISDFRQKGETDPLFAKLYEIVSKNNMMWNGEAERYLLEHAEKL